MLEERAGAQVDADHVAIAPRLELVEAPDRRFAIARHLPERQEVMCAEQFGPCRIHTLEIHAVGVIPAVTVQKRPGAPAVIDAVAVPALARRSARVKIRRGFFGCHGGDVGRRQRIDRPLERLGSVAKARLETNDLAGGVDSGIRAAGKLNHDRLSDDPLQHVLQHALNRAQPGLHLKAVEVGTVVLDDNSDL